MNRLAAAHPLILFLYYVVIISLTMFVFHPILVLLSFIGALFFNALLTTPKQFFRDIGFYFGLFLLIAITNPIFVHKGETILFFLNDNPVTKEAFFYGFAIALMLVAVIYWSKSYSYLMTSDKFIYLFGRIIPKLSLIVSMALRYIPQFKQQIKNVHQAQRTLGLYTSDSMVDRLLGGIRTFNSVLTWSLENAIIQADAMKARGYGLKGRTNFSLFKWNRYDFRLLTLIGLLTLAIVYFQIRGVFVFYFYPAITSLEITLGHILKMAVVLLLMMLPTLIEIKENLHWRYLRSRI